MSSIDPSTRTAPGNRPGIASTIGAGLSVTAKVVVSLLWVAGGVAAVAAGTPALLAVVVAYLIYLWGFGGRFLIY